MKLDYKISENCIQCGTCAEQCPVSAIRQDHNDEFMITQLCENCGDCIKVCPAEAIVKLE